MWVLADDPKATSMGCRSGCAPDGRADAVGKTGAVRPDLGYPRHRHVQAGAHPRKRRSSMAGRIYEDIAHCAGIFRISM